MDNTDSLSLGGGSVSIPETQDLSQSIVLKRLSEDSDVVLSLEQKLKEFRSVMKELRTNQSMDKATGIALESMEPGLLSAKFSLKGLTEYPSKTFYTNTLEALSSKYLEEIRKPIDNFQGTAEEFYAATSRLQSELACEFSKIRNLKESIPYKTVKSVVDSGLNDDLRQEWLKEAEVLRKGFYATVFQNDLISRILSKDPNEEYLLFDLAYSVRLGGHELRGKVKSLSILMDLLLSGKEAPDLAQDIKDRRYLEFIHKLNAYAEANGFCLDSNDRTGAIESFYNHLIGREEGYDRSSDLTGLFLYHVVEQSELLATLGNLGITTVSYSDLFSERNLTLKGIPGGVDSTFLLAMEGLLETSRYYYLILLTLVTIVSRIVAMIKTSIDTLYEALLDPDWLYKVHKEQPDIAVLVKIPN